MCRSRRPPLRCAHARWPEPGFAPNRSGTAPRSCPIPAAPSLLPIHKQLLAIQELQEFLDCRFETPSAYGEVDLKQSWRRQPGSSTRSTRTPQTRHADAHGLGACYMPLGRTRHEIRARFPAWIRSYPQSVGRVLDGKELRFVIQLHTETRPSTSDDFGPRRKNARAV